jgi:hypothetical protein
MAGKVNVSLIQQFLQLFQFRLPVCRNLCHTLRIAAENITDAIVLYLPQFLIEKLHLKHPGLEQLANLGLGNCCNIVKPMLIYT